MSRHRFCEVCLRESAGIGVCFDCAMAVNEIDKIVDEFRLIHQGSWRATLDGCVYRIERLCVFKQEEGDLFADCLLQTTDPAQTVEFFKKVRAKAYT